MRGTGRTTKQIITAPKNAIYLCKNLIETKMYKEIAIENNRQDLTFIHTGSFHQKKLMGLRKYLIIDHAIKVGYDINHETFDYINFHNNHIRLLND